MQLSFDQSANAERLQIVVTSRADKTETSLEVYVKNHKGDVLSSMHSWLKNDGEAELLPQMLHLVALSWLFRDATACVEDPRNLLAEHRKRAKWGKLA